MAWGLNPPDAHHLVPGYSADCPNFTDVLVSVAGLFAQHDGFRDKEWTLFIQRANAHFPTAT